MRRSDFERVVQQALRGLPAPLRDGLRNIAVVVEEFPPEEVLEEMGLESPYDLLGLYQGVSLDRRGFYYGNVLPDKISLYQKPIEEQSTSRRDMILLIRDVVLHEVGHYFGLDDEALYELAEEEKN
jgi:predicted Zn-dependent protease with MMP-like domain